MELRCFEMPSLPVEVDNVACCACARMPDGALGKIIASRKHRALAGCKREGAVCICRTINFLTKSFITNEQYEPRNADYITLCIYVCPYIYQLKFLMNHMFSCCFEITITPGGLAGHMRPVTSVVRPASTPCCWLCHLSSNGLAELVTQSGTVHRKYTGLLRRIDRNEYYFVLLYIVRQVTIPYSALQFRRNSPVFWCFEIPRVPGHKVACRACVRIPMYSGL